MSEMIGLSITIYGMALVISFAALIKGIVVGLPLMRRREEPEAPSAPVVSPGVPAEHIAAIAGAVTAIAGPSHIIHLEDRGRTKTWTSEGRMIHQTSHAVRTRKN